LAIDSINQAIWIGANVQQILPVAGHAQEVVLCTFENLFVFPVRRDDKELPVWSGGGVDVPVRCLAHRPDILHAVMRKNFPRFLVVFCEAENLSLLSTGADQQSSL